ncbi:MAG: branched-chain amino acid ABC transporter permease [Propionibacteriales bacterium]|nr:branched-chain amino acid ABC transporter permease [Propionibacteriales bacterium]
MDWGPLFTNSLEAAIGPVAITYCLAAIGLNIHFGYTGLLNFGQAAFMAIGGYGLGAAVVTFGVPFVLALLIGFGGTAVLAVLLGLPTLRLRTDYLAITTLAAAEIIRQVLGSLTLEPWLGGKDGRQGFAATVRDLNPFSGPVDLGIVGFRPFDAWVILIGWLAIALSCLVVWLLMRSPWGRVLKGIREDEDAVRALGKNVYGYKMQALMLGGLFGCVAGFMMGVSRSSVVPDNFQTDLTFFAFCVLLLGGAARVFGPVVGAILLWGMLNVLGNFFGQATSGPNPIIPTWIMDSNQSSLVRFIVLGIALMLLMIYRPQGIFGDKRELAIHAR